MFPDVPKFGEPISNVTIPVGREATLTCVVEDLATYKVRHIDTNFLKASETRNRAQNNMVINYVWTSMFSPYSVLVG